MAAIVLGAFTMLAAVAWWIFSMAAERELAVQIRDARGEGLLLDLSDLHAKVPIPANENAGPIYLKAAEGCKAVKIDLADLDWLSGAIVGDVATPQERADAKFDVAKMEPLMKLIRRAVAWPRCDFERPWEQSYEMDLRDLAAYKQLSSALSADAVLAEQAGDDDHAFGDLIALAHMGYQVSTQPSLMEAQSGRSRITTSFGTLERVMALRPLTRERAVRFAQVVKAGGPFVTLRQSLLSELPLERDYIERVGRDSSGFEMNRSSQLARLPSVRRRAHTRLIATWRMIFQALVTERVDYAKTKAALQKIYDRGAGTDPISELISYPHLVDLIQGKTDFEAKRRIWTTAATIFHYRATTGTWPVVAPDLGLDSVDPFTGHALAYSRTAKGFRIYSVGRDGVDDHGRRRDPKGASDQTFDTVFEYPRPPVPRSAINLLTRPTRPKAGVATPGPATR